MAKEGLNPIEQANTDFPKAWYEISFRKHMAFQLAGTLGLYWANEEFLHIDSVPASIVAASIYVISALSDRYSTAKFLQANLRAEEEGLGTLVREANPIYGVIETPRDVVTNETMLALDAAGTVLSLSSPAAGLYLASSRLIAAKSNMRVAARVNRVVELSRE